MNVLAIESSCDETAAAVVSGGRHELSSVVASQVEIHAEFGGVVPEVASRQHLRMIGPVIEQALDEAGCELRDLDAIAATRGPGLAGALLVGFNAGKALAYGRGLPFLGVNHLEGHIYANWLTEGAEPELPALALVVSGGHTDLVFMERKGDYRRIGGTLDDAAGEAFDKVGRLLGLPFPGGPHIARRAESGGASDLSLPRAWLPGTMDFSFSGLKTAALHAVRANRWSVDEVAWEFQEAVVDVLAGKTAQLARDLGACEVLLAGGVAANNRLREEVVQRCPVPVRIPPPRLCTDNAAMIGAIAGQRLAMGERTALDADIFTQNDWAEV